MLNCNQVEEQLPLWVGGDLSVEELKELEAHFANCEECRTAAEQWRRDHEDLVATVRSASPPELDAATMDRAVERAIEAALATDSGRNARPRRSMLWRYVAPLAAVLALVVLWRSFDRAPTRSITPEPAAVATASWEELQEVFAGCLDRPVAPAQWQAAGSGGLIAVLSPAPSGDGFVVADCIEAASLSQIRRYPWLKQRLDRYRRSETGERDILLAVCPTGDLDRTSRRKIQREVLTRFRHES